MDILQSNNHVILHFYTPFKCLSHKTHIVTDGRMTCSKGGQLDINSMYHTVLLVDVASVLSLFDIGQYMGQD